jgi:hypothetical protein
VLPRWPKMAPAVAAAPPMTSRQAKRLAKKQTAQFKYTASQMRRADRIDELEQRRQDIEDKERRRKQNKRKRDEHAAKDREAKRKLLSGGKIKLEDTWAKVTASQPRLNNFFVRKTARSPKQRLPPPPPSSPLKESSNALNKANGVAETEDEADVASEDSDDDAHYDSQEETLVDKTNALNREAGPTFQEFTDADFLQLFSSQPGQLTPATVSFPTPSHYNQNATQRTHSYLQDLPAASPANMARAKTTDEREELPKLPAKPPTTSGARTLSNPATPTAVARPVQKPRPPNNPDPNPEPGDDDDQYPPIPSTEPTPDPAVEFVDEPPVAEEHYDDCDEASARAARSKTPSPESAERRRLPRVAHPSSHASKENEAEAEDGDDMFGDGGIDDAALAALVSPVPVSSGFPFASSLPDEEMLRAVEEAEKAKKK